MEEPEQQTSQDLDGTQTTLPELLGGPELTSASSQAYLSYLTTLSLPNLLAEPTLLQTQSHHLTSSLTSLTHTSYPTFLTLHSTTSSLSESLDTLSASLDALVNESLPALEESASNWHDRTDTVLTERNKARVVLEQHDKIRDLLDIPVLIDTCVRNGYFAEALSLASHTNSLYSSSSSPPLILTSIISEVRNSITQMLFSLLSTLHEPNRKLPALWKAVNFLRKMNVFDPEDGVESEEQIALAFLGGREVCLKASLEGCNRDIQRLAGLSSAEVREKDKEDLTRYLKKYIDIWREGVHDIITQFSTIFLERPTSTATSPAPAPPLRSLLVSYASHSLHRHLLPLLRITLPRIPLPSLSSLLTQLTYCATAFARVGFDFRGVLGDLFSDAVLSSVTEELQAATSKWVTLFKQKMGRPVSTTSTHTKNMVPPSEWLVLPAAVASQPTSSPSYLKAPAHVPPHILVSYPPLAQYTNALLSTLNSLRLLAPTSIMLPLLAKLEDFLSEGGEVFLRYAKNAAGLQGQEVKITEAVGDVYFNTFVRFMRRALGEGVYGLAVDNCEALRRDVEKTEGGSLDKVIRDWEGWLESRKTNVE
ncbi:Dor1-like family-domain-containing protein [Desarmillaria tabescens]|uniref:Conserved oligomeric Golgi complex subunit 8 n=1 Tax=Armillaria tabescens TaxID=1929756 RepID=A0AA39T5P5_ARMTA|nr:Dor1-like family-domain-containing protein [Desarmillaria tabescens]KAK0466256.1 Dor1-like family-domain-containing protein [Desarmillaria tabescens]